jgi:hypothetical protein
LTSVLDGDEWSASRPGCFTPRTVPPVMFELKTRMVPVPIWTLWSTKSSLAPAENRPRVFQSVSIPTELSRLHEDVILFYFFFVIVSLFALYEFSTYRSSYGEHIGVRIAQYSDRLLARRPRFDSQNGQDISLLHSVHTVSGVHSVSNKMGPGGKRTGLEANHSPTSHDEFKNVELYPQMSSQ